VSCRYVLAESLTSLRNSFPTIY